VRYVIRYDDGMYDADLGWPVRISEATVYDTRAEAERAVENIGDGEVVEYPEPSKWIEGGWDGRAPIIPDDFPEFVWVAIYYPWKRGGAEARPHSGEGLETTLHSISLSLAAQAERDGKPVLPPPRWVWMPLAPPPSPEVEKS